MATARILCMQGQSVANGAGYTSDLTSNIPNQSLGYHGWYLRHPWIRPWTASQAGIVSGELRYNGTRVYSAGSAGTAGTTAPTHSSGGVSDGSITWTYLRDALADVPSYPGAVGVELGYVFKTSANRHYQVIGFVSGSAGILSGTEPTATTSTGVTNGGLRLKYLDTNSEVRKLNEIYSGGVKIWDNSSMFRQMHLGTSSYPGEDADGVRIGQGPQIPIAAHMLNRWNDAHSFIVKHAVDGRSLGYIATTGNYSIQQYDAGGGNAYLKTFLDGLVNAMNVLLGTSVTAWTSSATISAGVLRKNSGNVYQLLQAGGGTTSDAPVHTSGTVTGADGYVWKWLHEVYTGVDIIGLLQEHGAQDSVYNIWAYDYRYAELNLWRRFHHRLQFSTGNNVYLGYIEPFVPRNQEDTIGGAYKIAFAEIVRKEIKDAISDFVDEQNGSAVTPVDNGNYISYGNRATYTKTYDLYASPYFNRAVDDLHYLCLGTETMIDRWFDSYDAVTPTARTWGGSETTSFYGGGSRPVLTYSSGAAWGAPTTLTLGSTVTCTLANSGLNGGSSSSIEWYSNQDDSIIHGTGLSVTFAPKKYNGQVLHARYKDPNGYWAHYFCFYHVLAPRNVLTDYTTNNSVTIKHWMRAGIGSVGTNLTVNGSVDYVPNYTGATSTIRAIRGSGVTVTNLHPDGLAMQKLDVMRFNGNSAATDNTTDQQAAAIVTASDANFTLFFKGVQWWRADDVAMLYGTGRQASGSGVNGGQICLAASASADGDATTFQLSARRANGVTTAVVSGSQSLITTDQYNAGEQIVVALIKNGTTWQLRWRTANGAISSMVTTGATALDADGYPTAIGYISTTLTGGEGVVQEVIGLEHAITDNVVVDSILQQLASEYPSLPNISKRTKQLNNLMSIRRR